MTLSERLRSGLKRIPGALILFRFIRDNRFLFRAPRKTSMGFWLTGNAEMEDGTFEREEVEVFDKLVRSSEVFVDVGANIGYYCLLALQAGIETIAFEPMPGNLRFLYKNIRANGWDRNIEVHPIALGDTKGIIDIFGSGTAASVITGWAKNSRFQKRIVPMATLDGMLADRLDGKRLLILIDTEGAERLVLAGAARLLEMHPKPKWIVEISVTENWPEGIQVNPHLQETFQLFWKLGYEARTADAEFRTVTPGEIGEICSTGRDTLRSHNFLFEHTGKAGPAP